MVRYMQLQRVGHDLEIEQQSKIIMCKLFLKYVIPSPSSLTFCTNLCVEEDQGYMWFDLEAWKENQKKKKKRIHLLMQGTRVQSLVGEDSTRLGATKHTRRHY